MTPLGTSLSTKRHLNPTGSYTNNKTPTNRTSVQHTWWDESQFDLDLADDSIIIGTSEKPPTQKQRFKKKLRATIKSTHINYNDHPRGSWVSTSSSRSSLHSTNSLSIPNFSQISHSKLSSPFIHLKHLFQKH